MLVKHEIAERNRKRIDSNRRKAGFPVSKQLEEFDYRFQTTITKRQINQLLNFQFIKVLFTTALALSEALEIAELKGELKKKITSLLKTDLLVIDELGYLPMNKQGVYNLFQLINSLYEYRSIILTTYKDFTN